MEFKHTYPHPGRQPSYPQSSPYPVAQTSMPTPYSGAYRQQSPQTAYPQPQGKVSSQLSLAHYKISISPCL